MTPRSSEIICSRIFAFTIPFRFINQRTCGDLYSRVLVFVLRVILMTPTHLLFHCHHSLFSEQAAGCPRRTFSFHLHTRLLLALYNFKTRTHAHTHTGSRSTPLRSCAFISIRSLRNVTHRQCSSWNEVVCWQVHKL